MNQPLVCSFLCVAAMHLGSGGSLAIGQDFQWPERPTNVVNAISLIVPSEIPAVQFGDPIYVPLAVYNSTKEPQLAPLFRHYRPWFSYAVRSGNETSVSDQYGKNGGESHTLPRRSVETTVLLVNIWAPGIALEFLRTGEARIEFTAYAAEPYKSLPLEAATTVKLRNADAPFDPESAFTIGGHKRVYDIAYRNFSPAFRDSPENSLSCGDPSGTAFMRGQSPLNWLDFKEDNMDSWHADSKFYKDAKAMVQSESSLHRMMTFIELRNELRGTNENPTRTSLETLDAYFDLLGRCHPSERHFNIVALNAVGDVTAFPREVREPDMNWEDLSNEIRRRLPTYGMYFTGEWYNRPYSTVSLIDHSYQPTLTNE